MTTIDLELAQELQSVCKEKGIELPESEFTYVDCFSLGAGRKETCNLNCYDTILAPAYTLDELLEILPKSIKNKYRLCLTTNNYKEYMIYYEKHTNAIRYGTNPANAACKLLIWLIKEALL